MLIDTNTDYVQRVNGVPLYYYYSGVSYYHPYATPPPYDTKTSLMTSKIIPPESCLSPITLTPPLSPNLNLGTSTNVVSGDQSRRGSVIMKVENCQIIPANERQISVEHVCRWENCYK